MILLDNMLMLISIASFILTVCACVYYFYHIIFFRGLGMLHPAMNMDQPSVSIIIAARNEANNIGACLEALLAQDYPLSLLEIVVVDDHSTDETSEIVRLYQQQVRSLRYVKLSDDPLHQSPKKRAITAGIEASHNDIIVTTDADCTMSPYWLGTLVSHFEDDIGVVAGWVLLDRNRETTIFHKIQSLEFLSLVIAGAGSIGAGKPLIANGANLAYRRDVFDAVDGFAGIDHLASGDDDMFVQKVASYQRWRIASAMEIDAQVYTQPVDSFADFLKQRFRWASKGVHYQQRWIVRYLVAVYLFYLGLFIGAPIAFVTYPKFTLPIWLFALKILFDAILLFRGLFIARRRDLFRYFIFAELFQIPYILLAGVAGLFKISNWK